MSADSVWVLQRLNWQRQGGGAEGHPEIERFVRLPGFVRLASFDHEADALAECARREEQARRVVNPFCCDGVGLHFQTDFADGILRDWLLDADIVPPEEADWIGWWESVKARLTEAQWAHVWRALDRLVFHEVVARPRKPVVCVVAEIGWEYNDSGYDPRPEGGVPVRAFRSRTKAEAERQRRETEARRGYRYFDGFDVWQRLRREQPFADLDPADRPAVDDPTYPLFFEVIEVELDDLAGGPA